MLKESADLEILEETFDAKMVFEKHLFALFPVLHPRGLVSMESPGE